MSPTLAGGAKSGPSPTGDCSSSTATTAARASATTSRTRQDRHLASGPTPAPTPTRTDASRARCSAWFMASRRFPGRGVTKYSSVEPIVRGLPDFRLARASGRAGRARGRLAQTALRRGDDLPSDALRSPSGIRIDPGEGTHRPRHLEAIGGSDASVSQHLSGALGEADDRRHARAERALNTGGVLSDRCAPPQRKTLNVLRHARPHSVVGLPSRYVGGGG